MEVDNTAIASTSRKRTVDAANNETEIAPPKRPPETQRPTHPKRPRINLDNEMKSKILKYVYSEQCTGFI